MGWGEVDIHHIIAWFAGFANEGGGENGEGEDED